MTKNIQRQSQVVSTFGPGSMVDLPTRSVVIGGLEFWDIGACPPLSEARLSQRLERLLKEKGRLAEEKSLMLRTPPVGDGAANREPPGVLSPTFPRWFVCEQVEAGATPSARCRRLVRWEVLDIKGRRRYVFEDGKKSDVTPIRFVCACEKGHLQDIAWRWVSHGAAKCKEPMWIEEQGTSADPADTAIVCGCGKRLSLQELFQPGRLGKCVGERPWLLDRDPDGCGRDLKLLTRTATNTYFPQVLTVISLPAEEDELSKIVDALLGQLANVTSVADVAVAKRFNPALAGLGPYQDGDIFTRLERIRSGAQSSATQSPKIAEFDVLGTGRREIGVNRLDAKLFAETLDRDTWDPDRIEVAKSIRNLVAVHRLREVSCLYGFTRFEAAPTSADGDIEDIYLAVDGAPVAKDADWLPAVELFGEGLFVHFEYDAVTAWLNKPEVRAREEQLLKGYEHWAAKYSGRKPDYPGTPYVLFHSLSHALMQEIALDCGYPASSLKERVYALRAMRGGAYDRCGLMIYTASAGAQGTLGGLVGIAPRFARILEAALRRLEICSNDPICADHEPDDRSGDRATHGAACHGCMLIAETSCESRNLFLDRALLVSTMGVRDVAFFELEAGRVAL